MGHLINPIAFRLSFFKSWEDTWFIKNIYYPEFLNGMLKLRNYIYYILTNKGLLKSGIFLSNFFILKYNKLFIINMYIYHIDYEKLSYSLINNFYTLFFNYGRRSYKKKKLNTFYKLFMPNSEFFMFIIYFYKIFYKNKKKNKSIKSYVNSNLFYKSNDLVEYYNELLQNFNDELRYKYIVFNNKGIEKKWKPSTLNEHYWQKIFFFNLKNDNYVKLYNYKGVKYGRFTLFEFILFLLKKINYKFKSKPFMKIVKIRHLIILLRIFKYVNIKFSQKHNFLLFYLGTLLHSIAFDIMKNRISKIKNKFYYILYESIGYKFFFKQLKVLLLLFNNIFFILNKVSNVRYRFYFLSNRNITAKWLSRYIGLKLKNNYSFYSVLNPVKRELYKLCLLNRRHIKQIYSKKNFINSITLRNKYKLKFKNLIKDIYIIYIKEYYLFYINNKTFVYDFFLFLKNLARIYMPTVMEYLPYTYKYFIYPSNFSNFLRIYKYLYINIFINNYWGLNLLNKNELVNIVIDKISNILLINTSSKLKFYFKGFYVSNFFVKSLFNFLYFKYMWLQVKHINVRNVRNDYKKHAKSALIGYKLAFKGRFSRKQRASNIWYMHGKVPLNTLSIKLDYSFFTIPLKNSAISIKIILYKNKYNEKYKYLLIY
jgi:hypothetical protein